MMESRRLPDPDAPNSGFVSGQIAPGNIDIYNRPKVRNADGSTSSVRSASFGMDGQEVLIPTVSEDGRIMDDDEALSTFRQTGRHLGVFDSVKSANAYAKHLHEQQERISGRLTLRDLIGSGP